MSSNNSDRNSKIKIGVLALQGAFREHANALRKFGIHAQEIRFPWQLDDIDGLIIPGGESTTIIKLIDKYNFNPVLKRFHELKKPIFGTCAGLILLAKNIREGSFGFGYIDIDVERNAYGRQVDSFEQDVELAIGNNYKKESFKAVFIRAPKITKTGKNVKVLGNLNGNAILARQESILVCAFHPELTDDTRIHSYFIDMVKKSVNRLKNQ